MDFTGFEVRKVSGKQDTVLLIIIQQVPLTVPADCHVHS